MMTTSQWWFNHVHHSTNKLTDTNHGYDQFSGGQYGKGGRELEMGTYIKKLKNYEHTDHMDGKWRRFVDKHKITKKKTK